MTLEKVVDSVLCHFIVISIQNFLELQLKGWIFVDFRGEQITLNFW